MNIWTSKGLDTLGYHFTLSGVTTFIKEKDTIIARVEDLFSGQKEVFLFNNANRLLPGVCVAKQQCIIPNLLKRGFVPDFRDNAFTFVVIKSNEKVKKQLIISIDQAIKYLNGLLFTQAQHPPEFNCPITLGIIENPVMDEHGHIFEKSAIEYHLQTNPTCPLSRQPIDVQSLTPHISLEKRIARIRNEASIPLLPSMQRQCIEVDLEIAQGAMRLAKESEKKGDYSQALDRYKQAFQCTDRSEDYEKIPSLFLKMKEPCKAALAYLHLALQQILEKKSFEESLVKAGELFPKIESLIPLRIRAFSLQLQGDREGAGEIFCLLANQDKSQAMFYLEQALECCPNEISIYKQLTALYVDNAPKRVLISLLGLARFYKTDNESARKFYEDACNLQPDNPMVYFAFLNCLAKDDAEKIEIYRILIKIFIKTKETKKVNILMQKQMKIMQKQVEIMQKKLEESIEMQKKWCYII